MDDQTIIDLYFARNEDAIRHTDAKYGRYCKGISMNLLNSEPDAEECVNDTWLKAWNSIPPARPSVLRAYLGKIVRRLSIDRYRRLHSAKYNCELEVALDELSVCAPEEGQETGLKDALTDFLITLAPLDRKLFVGRYWYTYAVADLARAHGMTANAVSIRLHKLRIRLKEHLCERGYAV